MGQGKMLEGGNQTTKISKLLEKWDLKDCISRIGVIGYQKEGRKRIRKEKTEA
ncbi:MAG: hypothetical protein SNJ78_10935 [Spirochaetales bacterium]